jgi:hypothetical protein
MKEAVAELVDADHSYRNSLPDITHHHLKLLYNRKLWSSILKESVRGWKIRNVIDEKMEKKLSRKRIFLIIFYILGILPFFGNFIRKIWGNKERRRHYSFIIKSYNYFRRAVRARNAEALIHWLRAGRVNEERALKLARHPSRFMVHIPLSVLPPKMHRFFSDWDFTKQSLDYIFVRPLRLYFRAEAREEWLRELLSQGQKNGILAREEATRIISQLKEPFIQKYLKSLAVHICTVPVTQIVSVFVAIIYVKLHPELAWQEATVHAALILGFFQVIPISPGSLVRGLYVSWLVLREKNFRDYNIAFYLSFFKYIGYLAFPIQMAYRYPDLARFMAGHWATGAAHIVPVFGERGALLEHTVFDTFYNYPLNLRQRIQKRQKIRSEKKPRHWHLPLVALSGTTLLALIDILYLNQAGQLPHLGNIWWLALWIPLLAAGVTSRWAGGELLKKRILMGLSCGALIGLLYSVFNTAMSSYVFIVPETSEFPSIVQFLGRLTASSIWKIFVFSILSLIGAFVAETRKVRQKK